MEFLERLTIGPTAAFWISCKVGMAFLDRIRANPDRYKGEDYL